MGLAFYVWDYGCKHGDLRVLGASAYFAPLLSTLLLILFGLAESSPVLWLAALAITGGALLASKDLLLARGKTDGNDPCGGGCVIRRRTLPFSCTRQNHPLLNAQDAGIAKTRSDWGRNG